MAAVSARSLKAHLPFARTVLLIGCMAKTRSGNHSAGSAEASATSGNAPTWVDDDEPISAAELSAFDEVIHWSNPALYTLSGLYPEHRGWLLKPAMLAASPYEHTVREHAHAHGGGRSRMRHCGAALLPHCMR